MMLRKSGIINVLLMMITDAAVNEPTLKEGWGEGMRYSTIHYLRRVYAYVRAFPARSPVAHRGPTTTFHPPLR